MQMKTTCLVKLFAMTLCLVLAGVGCGHSSKPGKGIEGHWSGFNTKRPDYACTVSITGNQLEYHGADTNDWVRGNFVIRTDVKPNEMDLTVAEQPKESNHKIFAIYQVEGDEMTVAISSSQRPADFAQNPQNEVFNFRRD
jgi:uncharacterized protein (TIGR03067 family)